MKVDEEGVGKRGRKRRLKYGKEKLANVRGVGGVRGLGKGKYRKEDRKNKGSVNDLINVLTSFLYLLLLNVLLIHEQKSL